MPFTIRLSRVDELSIAHQIDDAAARLFAEAGLPIDVPDEHPFVREERARWRKAAEHEGVYFAAVDGVAAGFVVLGAIDDHAYLDQLSVVPEYGRRGIGRALLEHACSLARVGQAGEIWLTTYAHLPFNRQFYESAGFGVVPERNWGPELRRAIEAQRLVLPLPEQRIAMRRTLAAADPRESE
jgi:ribosomal protein S18 acetylase RimI-like enzyme